MSGRSFFRRLLSSLHPTPAQDTDAVLRIEPVAGRLLPAGAVAAVPLTGPAAPSPERIVEAILDALPALAASGVAPAADQPGDATAIEIEGRRFLFRPGGPFTRAELADAGAAQRHAGAAAPPFRDMLAAATGRLEIGFESTCLEGDAEAYARHHADVGLAVRLAAAVARAVAANIVYLPAPGFIRTPDALLQHDPATLVATIPVPQPDGRIRLTTRGLGPLAGYEVVSAPLWFGSTATFDMIIGLIRHIAATGRAPDASLADASASLADGVSAGDFRPLADRTGPDGVRVVEIDLPGPDDGPAVSGAAWCRADPLNPHGDFFQTPTSPFVTLIRTSPFPLDADAIAEQLIAVDPQLAGIAARALPATGRPLLILRIDETEIIVGDGQKPLPVGDLVHVAGADPAFAAEIAPGEVGVDLICPLEASVDDPALADLHKDRLILFTRVVTAFLAAFPIAAVQLRRAGGFMKTARWRDAYKAQGPAGLNPALFASIGMVPDDGGAPALTTIGAVSLFGGELSSAGIGAPIDAQRMLLKAAMNTALRRHPRDGVTRAAAPGLALRFVPVGEGPETVFLIAPESGAG